MLYRTITQLFLSLLFFLVSHPMKSGVSLQNEFIRHYTFLGRQKINFKGFLYVSFGTNKLTNEDGKRGIGRNRKYGNVGRIVQKPDTFCEKILNMLMQNNNAWEMTFKTK